MTTKTIFATLAVPATAFGLFAQENATFTRTQKFTDESVMIAQGAAGMIGLSSEPVNFRYFTQEMTVNGRTVTNAPYSADDKTESVQTLADGTKITNTTSTRVYRDSQGRTRREMTLPAFGGETQPHTLVTIVDPVAGVSYTLDQLHKSAHKMPNVMAIAAGKMHVEAEMKLEAEAKARTTSSPVPTEYRIVRRTGTVTPEHQDLGDNMIEGVNAKGTREVSTIDTGVMGNDRPITISSERWFSPELQVEVKSMHKDPRTGETTHTLTNINRSEPDATLFQVPSDYTLEEVKGVMPMQKFEVHHP